MTHLTSPPGLRPRLCRDYLTAALVQQHVGDGRRVVCVSSSTGQPSPGADVIELCAGAEGIVTIAGTYFVSELKMRCRPSLPARSLPSKLLSAASPCSRMCSPRTRAHTQSSPPNVIRLRHRCRCAASLRQEWSACFPARLQRDGVRHRSCNRLGRWRAVCVHRRYALLARAAQHCCTTLQHVSE